MLNSFSYIEESPNSQNNLLKQKYENIAYTTRDNNVGNVMIILKNFNKKDKHDSDELVDFSKIICKEANQYSELQNKKTAVHIYLDGTTKQNFSLPIFKKIVKYLTTEFNEKLGVLYVYSKSAIFKTFLKMCSSFLHKSTKKKIKFINNY